MADTDKPVQLAEIRLWDLPLRLFHWALATAVTAAWLLGEFGPDVMTLHFWAGYAVIGLLAFRLVWGIVGPRHARFASFLYGPGTTLAYARTVFDRKPSYWPGHNPMGGAFVIAFLLVLAGQVATGLFADPEDYINVGPLASTVDAATNRLAGSLHETLSTLILLMVLLHVGMIGFYRRWKGEDLIRPMITGWKKVRKSHQQPE